MAINNQLKKLFRHSIIYGVGDVLNRLAAFLLLPLYTRVLKPAEFGTLELIYLTASFLTLFLGRQLSHASLRFYFEYEDPIEQKAVISTSFISSVLFAGTCMAVCSAYSERFSLLVFSSGEYSMCFNVIFLTIVLELSNEIFFAYLRAKEFSTLFISFNLLGLLLRLATTIYLVAFAGWGILGVLTGNLAGVGILWIISFFYMILKIGLRFRSEIAKEVIKYTAPLILVGFSGMFIGMSDRFVLKAFNGLSVVGIYALSIRFKSILSFLVINPFTRAYGPFRFSIMKEANAKEIYSRVTTYFCFLLFFTGLGVASLSKEVIEIMSDKEYWIAYKIIPVLILSGIFQGMYYMFQIGTYIGKRTQANAKLFFSGAILNILLLLLLARFFNAYGAAVAVMFTECFVAMGGLWLSQKEYFIEYEWKRLIKIAGIGFCLFLVSITANRMNLIIAVVIKMAVVLSFPFALYLLKFYTDEELSKIGVYWQKFCMNFKLCTTEKP